MKKVFTILIFTCFVLVAKAQYKASEPCQWDTYPPEVQKSGFGFYKSQLVQMDDEPALEEVILFSAHNGHYPYFDLFKNYYVIIDYYTKEVKYISDIVISTERDLILEDRNQDGKFELYRKYFKDGKFSVDEYGNKLKVVWLYDSIEWKQSLKGYEKKK